MIDGQKMSKSLGNFITINNIREQGVDGNVLRLALLTTHYRKPMNFSTKLLSDSKKMYNKFCKMEFSEQEYRDVNIDIQRDLSSLLNDLNTTAYIGYINTLYNKKQYALVCKMLELIGINLTK